MNRIQFAHTYIHHTKFSRWLHFNQLWLRGVSCSSQTENPIGLNRIELNQQSYNMLLLFYWNVTWKWQAEESNVLSTTKWFSSICIPWIAKALHSKTISVFLFVGLFYVVSSQLLILSNIPIRRFGVFTILNLTSWIQQDYHKLKEQSHCK